MLRLEQRDIAAVIADVRRGRAAGGCTTPAHAEIECVAVEPDRTVEIGDGEIDVFEEHGAPSPPDDDEG